MMALIPDDSMVNPLWELAVRITEEHAKALRDDPTLAERIDAGGLEAASQEADKLIKPVIDLRRAYDLHFEYSSAAPRSLQWSCIDLNSYEPAPDSEGESTYIGQGETRRLAMLDLLEQFGEFEVGGGKT